MCTYCSYGHAGRLRHDAAQQAERVVGIFVARAGRRGERNALGEPVVHHGVGGAQLLIAPRVVFGKARAVAQQLANGQRRRVARRPFHPREFRDPSRHGVFERQPAIVAQLQHRQRGKALGHRRNAERGVRRDRRLRGAVADPERPQMRHLAVDHHAPDHPGDLLVGGIGAEDAVDLRHRRLQFGHAAGVGKSRRGIGVARRERRSSAAGRRGSSVASAPVCAPSGAPPLAQEVRDGRDKVRGRSQMRLVPLTFC